MRPRSCIIDGEAVACGEDGIACFRVASGTGATTKSVFMWAFDLIELNGDDLRREPLDVRKATLASLLGRAAPGIRFNEHIEEDGPTVFQHACKLGLEGIVSKRKDFALQLGPFAALDQEQEPERAGGEARSGGGLGPMTPSIWVYFFYFHLNDRLDFKYGPNSALNNGNRACARPLPVGIRGKTHEGVIGTCRACGHDWRCVRSVRREQLRRRHGIKPE